MASNHISVHYINFRAEKIFTYINDKFKNYGKNNMGRITMIHRDPVFTNILIYRYER
jgi:hypothetical protein